VPRLAQRGTCAATQFAFASDATALPVGDLDEQACASWYGATVTAANEPVRHYVPLAPPAGAVQATEFASAQEL
jgi:hypothetical protein